MMTTKLRETQMVRKVETQYRWRKGLYTRGMSPQTFGEWLSLREGPTTAEDVVEEASRPSSEIREGFEWDDAKAGHAYRLKQARDYLGGIREVRVVVEEESREIVEVVADVYMEQHVPGKGYFPHKVVAVNEDYHAAALRECVKLLRGIRARFEWLSELRDMWDMLDDMFPTDDDNKPKKPKSGK